MANESEDGRAALPADGGRVWAPDNRRRKLAEAAARALAEAKERREAAGAAGAAGAGSEPTRHREFNGPAGPEPSRYGDWERKGKAVDF